MGTQNLIEEETRMPKDKKLTTFGDLFDKAVDKTFNNQQFSNDTKNTKSSQTTFGIDISHQSASLPTNIWSMSSSNKNSTKQSQCLSQQNHWTGNGTKNSANNSVGDFDLSMFDK